MTFQCRTWAFLSLWCAIKNPSLFRSRCWKLVCWKGKP